MRNFWASKSIYGMSNCKAFGHLRARNHAIGQTPRNVLAPHSPTVCHGSAAFDKRMDAAGETPERRRATPPVTPARHENDADITVAVRPSLPDNVEPESTTSNRN